MTLTADDTQLQNLEKLLRQWSNSICDNTKEIVNSAVGKINTENSVEGGIGILNDVRDRQSRVISVTNLFIISFDTCSNLKRFLRLSNKHTIDN